MEDSKKGIKGIKGVVRLAKNTFKAFSEYRIPKLSGSLAYYTVFSLGPLLVVIISLCSIFLGREAIEGEVTKRLGEFIGEDTAAQLQAIIVNASLEGKSVTAMVIGGVALLLGATTVFAEIQDSINSLWGLKAKPRKGIWFLIRNRILSFSLIVSLGFLLLVSLALSAVIDVLGERLKSYFPDITVTLFYIINLIITFIITTVVFGLIFKVLPDAHIRWKDVAVGAVVTAILFMLGKFAISYYISRTNVGDTYGAAGSLVILLVWVYYSSMILYIGAVFSREYALTYGNEIRPTKYAVVTKTVTVEPGKEKPIRKS